MSDGSRKSRVVPVVLAIAVTFGCTAIRQQKAAPAVPDSAEFRNLQVFPSNVTRDQLVATMQKFTGALGVDCSHCHARVAGGGERDLDFASDAKPEKEVARVMMRMVATMNADYITKVNQHGQTVSCATCHRGTTIPDSSFPAASPRS